MPATTESQSSFLGRISIRRNQVASMEHEQELEDLELFQKHISERFSDLLSPSSDTDHSHHVHHQLLSISWLRKLLDAFLCCEAEFKAVLIMGKETASHIYKPPLDRLIPELLDRSVKALDVCNAVNHGVESVMHSQKSAQIVVSALSQRPFCEGQVRRAKKALITLLTSMGLEEKEGNSNNNKSAERTWSFGRKGGGGSGSSVIKDYRSVSNFRSLSWSVSKNWSASKQIQAMMSNLVPPRGNESNGLALPVYIMSTVMVFVMWALVAAIPCQERTGLATHFPVPRQLGWAQSMIGLQDKISEELKKKEKRSLVGLMDEMQKVEKLGLRLIEFTESFKFPMEQEKEEEVATQVVELAETCWKMEEGLMPLQQQIREVFHRIVRSRTEVLELLDQAGKSSTPIM